eukprot:c22843_g1_i1 orf=116-784(-)
MPELLCGHGDGYVCKPACTEAVLQSLHVKCTLRARVAHVSTYSLFHDKRASVSHLGHRPIRGARSSGDPPQPSSAAPRIPEGDGLNDEGNSEYKGGKESIMIKLRRYGVAGVLSYGLFNTAYYLGTFLFVWFYISPAPSGLGYRAAAERFIKLFALIWAGSQVTKLLRAGCALALAPAIDRGLTWLTDHSRFQSRAQVFEVIVASCFGLAVAVFLVITLLWA